MVSRKPDQFWFCDRYGRRNLINQSSAELNISNQKKDIKDLSQVILVVF